MRRPEYLLEYTETLDSFGLEAFRRAYTAPVLVGLGLAGRATKHTVGSGRRTHGVMDLQDLREVQHILDRVWPILKAQGAPPGRYITLGQSHESDITIPEHTLSSRHCAFGCKSSRTWIADLGSLNGTRVDNELLERRKLIPLRSGATLMMGRLYVAYLTNDAFVERLRR